MAPVSQPPQPQPQPAGTPDSPSEANHDLSRPGKLEILANRPFDGEWVGVERLDLRLEGLRFQLSEPLISNRVGASSLPQSR